MIVALRDRYEGTANYTPPQNSPVWRENLEVEPAPDPPVSRTISTNLAQSTFIAHLRPDLPVEIGAVLFFGLGVPNYTGYAPLYAGATGQGDHSSSRRFAATADAWGDGSVWQLFRRLQRAGDSDFESTQPDIRASWTAEHAVALERQRRFESSIAAEEATREEKRSRLYAFSWSGLARVLEHGRWLTHRAEMRAGRDAPTATD